MSFYECIYPTQCHLRILLTVYEISAVMGNNLVRTSLPGEVICNHEFYSYDAKYIDPNGARTVIPAELSGEVSDKIRNLAESVFVNLGARGLARVDFFLTIKGEIYINEINTMPGFTNVSMFPKMWEAGGLSYSELIEQLIILALEEAR